MIVFDDMVCGVGEIIRVLLKVTFVVVVFVCL